MDTIRKYSCPLEVTIEAIGGKWKCLILWWLRRDARRFSELKLLIPYITQKVLTQQLRELEREGLIYRESYPESPPRVEYALTPHGQTFTPIVELMSEWGKRHKSEYQFSYCRLQGMKVLVVSPEAMSICATLQERNAMAIATIKIHQIPDLITEVQPNAILIDLILLDRDNASLLIERIRQFEQISGNSVKIIAIVPRNEPSQRGQAFKMGFPVHIPKPIETIEMVSTLASLNLLSE